MIEYLLALSLGPLDRLRGSDIGSSKINTMFYGIAVALMLTTEPWQIAILMAAFVLGEASGWGNSLGHALNGFPTKGREYEWWQFGPLKTHPWIALIFRGFLWGLPVSIAGIFIGVPVATALPFIYAVSMPLAPALVRLSIGWHPAKHLWPMQEFVRGWLVGLMILGVLAWKP